MSVGEKILQLRMQSKMTQRELAESTGLAVSYLSRLENDHIAPTVRTLRKIGAALKLPLAMFFESGEAGEPEDRCPVSLSGRCILDQLFAGRGKKPGANIETYSPQQLEALRLCNLVLHTRDKELVRALVTILKSLLALSEKTDGKKNVSG